MYILYYKLIYFNIFKLTLYVFITEMAEYTRIQQKEGEEQDMDIQNIFEQELKPLEEDQDINEFITELFNENNTLPKCELDQWLEDYLEEMEIQQQKEGEQSQEVSDENNISSLLDMCHYSDISSVEDKNSPSSGQCEENKDEKEQDNNNGDNFYNSCNCIFCSRSIIYGEQQKRNIGTEPVTIQCGEGLPPIYGDEQEQEEEVLVGDDDLNVNVLNFPSTFFYLKLERTKSFKHKQDEIVNEQSYTAGLKENVITRNVTLGDIHNQLYLLFHSLLEEIHNVYTHQDLVRVYITHNEMVNTNIIVGPNYLGHITADVIMDRIASVVHSNNFIPANKGLQINIAAIKNIKGLKYGINSNIWDDLHRKGSIIAIKDVNDVLCLPRAIAVGIAYAEYQNDKLNNDLKKRFHTMKKNDCGDGRRCTFSLQKCTALEYQNKIGIPYYTPGILDHIPLYEKSLQVGITVISARSGNKRVYKGNSSYKLQVTLYHISDEDTSHFAVITRINALISRAYYCEDCDKGFNNRNYHRCTVWCNICGRNGCILNKNDTVQCIECNAPCHSMSCLNKHHTQKKWK